MLIVWITVIVIISLLATLYIKFEHQMKLVKFIIAVVLVVMLIVSVLVVMRSGEVDLSTPSGVMNAMYLYMVWLGEFTVDLWNIGVDTTGQVIKAVNVSDKVKE